MTAADERVFHGLQHLDVIARLDVPHGILGVEDSLGILLHQIIINIRMHTRNHDQVGISNGARRQLRDTLLILTASQSTFSINVSLRMLMYLAESYKQYVEDHKLDLYGTRPVSIPQPEL